MQRRLTVGPGSQKAPFRERLPGTISKLGKGTALQRRQTWGVEGWGESSTGGGGQVCVGVGLIASWWDGEVVAVVVV